RALRDMLDVCHRRHIQAMLLLMPEEAAFQNWYPGEARQQIDRYLAGLSLHYGAPVIDGRGWGAPTSFADGHHLLPGPAVDFTKRLAGEVLRLLAPGGHEKACQARKARLLET